MRKKSMRRILWLLLIFGLFTSRRSEAGRDSWVRGAELIVSEQSVSKATPGEEVALSFDLSNIGEDDAYSIYITALPSEDGDVVATDGTVVIKRLRSGDTERVSLNLKVSSSAASGIKRLPVAIRYRGWDADAPMKEVKFDWMVQVESVPENLISVSEIQFIPANVVASGAPFTVGLKVENVGSVPVSNVVLELQALRENQVFLTEGLNVVNIPALAPGKSEYLVFQLRAEEKASRGVKELKYRLSHPGRGGERLFQEGQFYFTMESAGSASGLLMENLSVPRRMEGEDTATVSFDLRNTGKDAIKNLTIQAIPKDPSGMVSKSVSVLKEPLLVPGESKRYHFSFASTPATATQNYPIFLSVTGEDVGGSELPKLEQVVGIFIKGADGTKTVKSVPHLVVEKFTVDPEVAIAGENCTMNLRLKNTHPNRSVKNLRVFLRFPTERKRSGAEESRFLFHPIEGSDSFHIPSVSPQGTADRRLVIYTLPETPAQTYSIGVDCEYEDEDGVVYKTTEHVSIPVFQEYKLEMGEIQNPERISAGPPVTLTIPFYNKGKSSLHSVMVKVEGEWETLSGGQYFIGNLAGGSFDQLEANVRFRMPGKVKGTVHMTYENTAGAVQTEEREIEVFVREYVPEPKYDKEGNLIATDRSGREIDMSTPEKVKFPFFTFLIEILLLAGSYVVFRAVMKSRREEREKKFI